MNISRWQVLEAAADVIDKYGHCKGTHGNERIGFCAQGAPIFVIHGTTYPLHFKHDGRLATQIMEMETPELFGALVALSDFVRGDGWPHIPDWNNAPERTGAEVSSAMRAVAAILKARAARLLPVIIGAHPERVSLPVREGVTT